MQDSVPQNGAIANQVVLEEMHICTMCERPFRTRNGLGQHIRRSHPVEYNEGINVERVKRRWTEEETDQIAREEVRAIRNGIVNMNQHLRSVFADRSLDSIKSKRRSQEYKDKVNALIEQETIDRDATLHDSIIVEEDESDRLSEESIITHIRALTDSLNGYTSGPIQQLIEHARTILEGNLLEPGTLFRWLKTKFKDTKPPRGIMYKGQIVDANMSRTKRRRQEYCVLQKMMKKDFGSAARRVLSGDDEQVIMPPAQEVVDFWRTIFEKEPVGGAEANLTYEAKDSLQGL